MPLNDIYSYFARYIETELGIVYAEHNLFQLESRLGEIAKALGVASVEKLFEQAQGGISGPLKQLLFDVATNNETSFFRDAKIFRAIETQVLPEFAAPASERKPMSIWSAASSSGQEALSVAMCLTEWSLKTEKKLDFKITGTDISERILTRAKAARYTQLEVERGLSAPLLAKYFKKREDDHWAAAPELMGRIDYKKLNLMEPFCFSERFDLVLCRNVLIYQSVERKREILKKIHATLAPGGYLILGSGESLIGLSDDFSQFAVEGVVFYRRKEVSMDLLLKMAG